MINHAHRCIYVHIPKTAGNSVNRVFGLDWSDHSDLGRYAGQLAPEVFASYRKFAIVRNPWDRLFSDYNYQKKKSRPRDSKLFLFKASGERREFRDWIAAALSDPHRYPPASWGGDTSPGIHRWSPQVDWITLDGRIAVDRVLRLERLGEEFPALCGDLGLPAVRLPRRNRRFHWHYSWYYNDETRDFVGSYYAKDVAAFGYTFQPQFSRAASLAQACAASLASLVTLAR
ncbi:MAG: sulfotransferase family 2 domain-containing protein [Verrucomicrobia bacterium]|nr:sulfotransferase family 2 domain-containing protein [Verrucomicrobiota bacterium]